MLFSTIGQIHVFLWMAGAGALIGALCALAAALRRLLCAGFWLTLAIDAATGLGAAVVLIAALVLGNYGVVRLYELLGAVAGLALFRLVAEPLLGAAARAVGRCARWIFQKIANFRLIKVIFR